MKKILFLFCLPLIVFVASCKKSDTKSPYQIIMKANVNGQDWSTTDVTSRYDILGTDVTLVILGQVASTGQAVALHVVNYGHGKGTIALVAKHDASPGVSADAAYSDAYTFNTATTGYLTITNVTADVIQGTFDFKAPGATASNGSFTVAAPH